MWTRLSPKVRRDVLRVLPFGIIWFLMAQVFLISDYSAAGSFSAAGDTAITVDPAIYFFAIIAVTIVGLLIGTVELLYLNRLFADRSLGAKLIGKTLFYTVMLTVIIIVTFPIAAAMEMDLPISDPRIWRRLGGFLSSKDSLGTAVQMTASLIISLFYSEIGEHLGPQVLRNFMTGRYHTPKEERRVFLFADMKSSTRIAERLGHARYFDLLRAYYDALSDAIVENGGQVHRYIGDAIIVTWPEREGMLGNACIHCVLRMKEDLRARAEWFAAHFGVVPDFKAGLQSGAVTTGEIGALKKEIVFTGDVLNQTARIQALCDAQHADILVGDEVEARVEEDDYGWNLRSLGEHKLRGKDRAVEIFALTGAG